MKLSEGQPGQTLRVVGVDDPQLRSQAIRFGLLEGVVVTCIMAVHKGPVVIRIGRQEVALGHGLARQIRVSAWSGGERRVLVPR